MQQQKEKPTIRICNKRGFTLIEMAVVLVVIGLIVGGMVTGSSMIRSAELQNVIKDYSKYVTAVNVFEEQYSGLPGDLPDAEDIWTAATNGDGDMEIDLDGGAGASANQESFEFWLQLAEARLIEGEYTGISGTGGYADSIGGENCPEGDIDPGLWAVRHQITLTAATEFAITPNNHFSYGRRGALEGWPQNGLLRVGEVYQIDKKFDDGYPATGSVMSRHWQNCSTATVRTDLTAEYNLRNDKQKCNITFLFEDPT